MFGSCEKFLSHVRINICAGDEIKYSRLMVWLGMLVQNPLHPVGTALVLRGKQGSGRSIFAEAIGALFDPQQFLVVSDSRHFMGRFNTHLKDNIVLLVDEALWSDKRSATALKNLICEDNIWIEKKGYDAEIIPNHSHVIMIVNTEWVAPKIIDDRRFLVLDVADSHRNNYAYFGSIATELNSGGREALSHILMGL